MIGGGGGSVGAAASDIIKQLRKRGDIAAQADGDEQRNRTTLPLIEALGTLRQRNARPDFLYLLGWLLRWYLLMPIVAELYHVLTPRLRMCAQEVAEAAQAEVAAQCVPLLGTFNWLLIWQTTGLPFMALVGSFVNVYAIGRTSEKIKGGAAPATAIFEGYSEPLSELGGAVIGRRRSPRVTREPLRGRADGPQVLDGIVVPGRAGSGALYGASDSSAQRRAHGPLNIDQVADEIERDEGRVYEVYPDPVFGMASATAGVGHLLTPRDAEYGSPEGTAVSPARVEEWFQADLNYAIEDARAVFADFDDLPHEARAVLVNLAFQLGRIKLANFSGLRRAIAARDWTRAGLELLWRNVDVFLAYERGDSDRRPVPTPLFEQTPERTEARADRLAALAGPSAYA